MCILHSAPPDSSWYCRAVCGCATKVTQTAIVFTCGIRTGWTSYTNYCLMLIPYPYCNQETEQEFLCVHVCVCVCVLMCVHMFMYLSNRHKSTIFFCVHLCVQTMCVKNITLLVGTLMTQLHKCIMQHTHNTAHTECSTHTSKHSSTYQYQV